MAKTSKNSQNFVYREFTQKELQREYSPSSCVPDIQPFLDRYKAESVAVYADHLFTIYAYGESLAETMDIFLPNEPNPALHLFIHGGYWQMLSKEESVYNAPYYLQHGTAFAALGYGLAPDVSLDEIVQQVRWAIWFVYKHAEYLCIDRERIYLSGHSAGAQLAMMALFTDWENDFDIPNNVIKGVKAISGIYDLEPLLFTTENEALQMDIEAAKRNSPIHHIVEGDCELSFCYGENETSEFKRQTDEFVAALREKGFDCSLEEVEGKNHFDVVIEEY